MNALLLSGQFEDARTRADRRFAGRFEECYRARAESRGNRRDEGPQQRTGLTSGGGQTRPDTQLDSSGHSQRAVLAGQASRSRSGFQTGYCCRATIRQPRLALANFYWQTGRRAEAESVLKEVITLEPNNASANRALAALYRATNRAVEAEAPLKRLADSSSGPVAKLTLADYYIDQKRVADARAILVNLSGTEEATAAARARLAGIEYDAGKRDAAYEILDEILAKDPGNADVMVVRGGCAAREGKHDDAKAMALKATQADPNTRMPFRCSDKFTRSRTTLGKP